MIISLYRQLFLFLWNYLGFFGALVGISVIVSAICLPIYAVIGKMVAKENELQGELYPQIDELKLKYTDPADYQSALERLYARYQYNPFLAIRKVLPLFVALPFLFLTYYMLEGTSQLNGVSFLCFKDVGKPDGLLLGVNLLPFVMTGINILTAYATPGLTKKDEHQALFIAFFFFVALYTANSALMIYWCLNQLFNFLRTLVHNRMEGGSQLIGRISFACSKTAWEDLRNAICLFIMQKGGYAVFNILIVTFVYWLFIYQKVSVLRGGGGALFIDISNKAYVGMIINALILDLALILIALREWSFVRRFLFITAGLFLPVFIGEGFLLVDIKLRMILGKVNVWFVLFTVKLLMLATLCRFRIFIGRNKCLKKGIYDWWLTLIFILLIPFVFSVHYIAVNSDFRSFDQIAKLLMYLEGLFLIVVVPLGSVFVRRQNCRFVLTVLGFAVMVICIIPFFAGKMRLFTEDNVGIIWAPVMFIVLSVTEWLFIRKQKMLFVLTFVFLGGILLPGLFAQVTSKTATTTTVVEKEATEESVGGVYAGMRVRKPVNIYILVADAYPSRLIINALNHADIVPELERRGFKIYENAYVPMWGTYDSMSRFFGIIDGVDVTDSRLKRVQIMCGRNSIADFLRAQGYDLDFILGVDVAMWCEDSYSKIPCTIRWPSPDSACELSELILNGIKRGMIQINGDGFMSKVTHADKMEVVKGILRARKEKPVFLYAHTDFPGHLAWWADSRVYSKNEKKVFAAMLDRANKTIFEMLDSINNDEDSIVVVMGDHGAGLYLESSFTETSSTPLSIVDRNGSLMAVKWPEDYRPSQRCLDFAPNIMLEIMWYLTEENKLLDYIASGRIIGKTERGLKTPDGIVDNGIIQTGKYKGMRLFDAALKQIEQLTFSR